MKTKEQLEAMTKDELVAYAMDKQKEATDWYNQWVKIDKKLDAIKNSISSLVVFID